jgi:hypothetical protein
MDEAALREALNDLDAGALDRLKAAIEDRQAVLDVSPLSKAIASTSTVLERRPYGSGVLQLETRAYKRKDGQVSERGPYWYFHYREDGRQKTLYVGNTEDPETAVRAKLG